MLHHDKFKRSNKSISRPIIVVLGGVIRVLAGLLLHDDYYIMISLKGVIRVLAGLLSHHDCYIMISLKGVIRVLAGLL